MRRTLFQRIVGGMSQVCGVIAALMILASVAVTCQMIWVRFVMDESTIWQTEVVIYLMIGATLLGLPYVQLHRGHVNVDLVPMMLPRRVRIGLAAATLMLTIAVTAVLAWYSADLWHIAFERNWRSDTVWGAKLWVPYLALPVGFGLYILQLIADLLGTLRGEEG